MSQTTRKKTARKTKPAKPYPDFPLFPHATGRWCKKIQGRFCYFGPWSDADGALGINCGFGNHDVGTLPNKALDLDGGWVNYPRPKTAIQRRCPLWQETMDAVRIVIEYRREPKSRAHAGLVFITKYGQPWSTGSKSNPISAEMGKLLRKLGIHRPGVSFYALRHCFETYGGESRDQPAVDLIMGHSRDDMASVYRERISDERLRAVVQYVHRWLFGE